MKPESIPDHIFQKSPSLWQIPENKSAEWNKLDFSKTNIISGSAFVDEKSPYGSQGNPFTVIIGDPVPELAQNEMQQIAHRTGTPETIFIHKITGETDKYEILLTVLTPTGKELGACAHGFTGAVAVAAETGKISPNSKVTIQTTLGTNMDIFLDSNSVILLRFKSEAPKEIEVDLEKLRSLLGVQVYANVSSLPKLPVYSVGSPKLTIELADDEFEAVRAKIDKVNYDNLLNFQKELEINGIHIFTRDAQTQLPVKSMQINAYLGEQNFVDPATGVSNAAQVVADENVEIGRRVNITQFTAEKASAVLTITKGKNGSVDVGGSAVLINYTT